MSMETPLECIGKLNLPKAQFCAFNTSDSTTIPLTVQNWIPRLSFNFRVPDSTTSSKIACNGMNKSYGTTWFSEWNCMNTHGALDTGHVHSISLCIEFFRRIPLGIFPEKPLDVISVSNWQNICYLDHVINIRVNA